MPLYFDRNFVLNGTPEDPRSLDYRNMGLFRELVYTTGRITAMKYWSVYNGTTYSTLAVHELYTYSATDRTIDISWMFEDATVGTTKQIKEFFSSPGTNVNVTQLTSKATGVTVNANSGSITLNGAALAAAAEVSFLVTNDHVSAGDVPVLAIRTGATAGAYLLVVSAVSNGSFGVSISNVSAGSLSQAFTINFVIINSDRLV